MSQPRPGEYASVSRDSLHDDERLGTHESIPLNSFNGKQSNAPPFPQPHHDYHFHMPNIHIPDIENGAITRLWDRFRGKGRKVPGVWQSIKNIATCSLLNILLVIIPIAWAAHFISDKRVEEGADEHHGWSQILVFILCFLAIIPLENLFDYGGEQMAMFVGKDLGDLIVITLNNAVEATLAIVLLIKCELRLLQATIAGVILLHLLLIPGTAFIIGGARVTEQSLHPHHTELNHALLSIGVLAVLVPTAIFSALGGGSNVLPAAVATVSSIPVSEPAPVPSASGGEGSTTVEHAVALAIRSLTGEVLAEGPKGVPGGLTQSNIVSDTSRATFLAMSRGIAILLLLVYIASRIFFHNPPGENNAGHVHPNAPAELKDEEKRLAEEDPEVNVWVLMLMLAIAIGLMAVTAEFLVESLEFVKEDEKVQEEWFGLILLPFVSFAADGAVAIIFFFKWILGRSPPPPRNLAKARAIDLSIQFGLFWMPFLVLLGWWTHRPLMLLFDLYEVAILLGSCFLVNYITADAKTNWAEGVIMVAFYIIIALCTWWYQGQPVLHALLQCKATVAQALAGGVHGASAEGGH